MTRNATEELRAAMMDAGITPPADIFADGRIHRFHIEGDKPSSKNGWYVLFAAPPAGSFGSWKDDISETWSAREYQSLTREEKAAYKANMEAAKAERERLQAEIHAECRERAAAIWSKAEPAQEDHPYLIKKGVLPHDAKDYKGALLLPVMGNDGTLHGLQFIDPGGDKRFLSGTQKKGHFSILGEVDKVLHVAEGFATAATIYEATGLPCAVAFDAGNLKPVCEGLRLKYPNTRLVVCADNDENGKGEMAAREAAEATGAAVVTPPKDAAGTDFNDLYMERGLDAVKRVIENAEPVTPRPDQDEKPLLFDHIETPEIPASLLPSWLGEYAEAVARNTQTPQGMAAMLALSTIATCTAKQFKVSPYGQGYDEPLNLWTATALPPASRKSAVISAMVRPLVEWEAHMAELLAPEIRQVAAKRRTLQKRRDKLETDAAKTADPATRDELLREIEALEDEMPEEIHAPRLWTGDTTPEKLQNLLADHGERMAVLTDEGGIFEIMAGLYSDGRANLDIFLQGHAGTAVRVDRQGRTAHMNSPALSFGLAIQPAVLADMNSGGKRRFRGNGTLARFLYCVPRSNIGTRDVREVYQIPPAISARYQDGLLSLLDIDNQEAPYQLTLSPDALESWQAFAQWIETRQGEGGDLEQIQDWSGKLPGAALRIAGNFHLVEYGKTPPAQIGQDTTEKALDFCELLIDHAKAAFNLMEADTITADAKALFKWIETERLTRFRKGEAYRQFKGRFTGKTERLDKALRELEARNIVTANMEPTAGRSATVYTVHPDLWGQP